MTTINLADLVDKSMECMSSSRNPRDIEVYVDVQSARDGILYIDESEIKDDLIILKN
ncbi:hypothetical protein [Staphylococcus capitis]|uniref:hypothetical protein n=1 Tax=Staphylococcus capitis TaxID=29388 RepID=UPI0032197220